MNHRLNVPPLVRLFLQQLPDAAIIPVATLGPVGSLKAPGTWGSAAGLMLYTVLLFQLSTIWQILLLAPIILFAWLWCDEAERRLAVRDPGEIILDEVVGQQFAFIGLNAFIAGSTYPWAWFLGGFALFRIFDILKPFGISQLQKLPGGLGVLVDDIAAGIASALVLGGIAWAMGAFLG